MIRNSKKKVSHLCSPTSNTRELFTGGENHINVDFLKQKAGASKEMASGKNLFAAALEAIKSGKKALACAHWFTDSKGNTEWHANTHSEQQQETKTRPLGFQRSRQSLSAKPTVFKFIEGR